VNCADCQWWDISPQDLSKGLCHLNPPTTMAIPMGGELRFITVLPITDRTDRCSKFESKTTPIYNG
jgi:hypothetical protein